MLAGSKRPALWLLASFALACGGDGGVDIVGKDPVDQADDVTTAECSRLEKCGDVNVDCDNDVCTGTFEPVDFDVCYSDRYNNILALIEECVRTAELERLMNDCVNALLDQGCPTQAELDAYVEELEAGNDDAQLQPEPQACVQFVAAIDCL